MKYFFPNSNTSKKGFTLVEMIVSVSIFAIVALIAVGALLKITDVNKKAQSIKTAVNGMNFMLESMSRELRVGSLYYCNTSFSFTPGTTLTPRSCNFSSFPSTSISWYLAFHSAKTMTKSGGGTCNLVFYYRFSFNVAIKELQIAKYEQTNCESAFTYMGLVNTGDLMFTDGSLIVNSGTTFQPYVKMHFLGSTGVKEKNKTYFNFQTSVSQRIAN